jgi:nitronate monooxygenase
MQAPMAGGPSTPQLTAAVSGAGAYGILAGGYLTAAALQETVDRTRALTGSAFGVNLFVPSQPADASVISRYASTLRADAGRLGVALGPAQWEDDAYAEKLGLLQDLRVDSVSFTFGAPDADTVAHLHDAGTRVLVTVTSFDEALLARAVGADGVVVQGTEAGGHQGTFVGDGPNTVPLTESLGAVREVGLPMIATGGVMAGRDLRAALDAGAVGVALGTALLCTPEAATSAVYRRALLERTFADTAITRAYTGRYARGLRNRFAREHDDAPAAYPEIHHLTRPLRAAATAAGDAEVPNMWAGTGWRAVTAEPAAVIVRRIAAVAR